MGTWSVIPKSQFMSMCILLIYGIYIFIYGIYIYLTKLWNIVMEHIIQYMYEHTHIKCRYKYLKEEK